VRPRRPPQPLNTQRRLQQLGRGRDLLRHKREALVSELFRLARPAADARALIAQAAARAYPSLLDVLGEEGYDGVRALGWPTRSFESASGRAWSGYRGIGTPRSSQGAALAKRPRLRAREQYRIGYQNR
jgi:hypothetical protein